MTEEELRIHLIFLIARFTPMREDGAILADRPVGYVAYLSADEYRNLAETLNRPARPPQGPL